MACTEMEFIQFHRIAHAHTMTQADYRYSLNNGGLLEIGVVEKNPLAFEVAGQSDRLIIGESDVYIVPPHRCVEVAAIHPGEHRHSSVEFMIDCTLRPACGNTADGARTVLLPDVLPASAETDELAAIIRQLGRDGMSMTEKSYFEECQVFMQIMSIVSALMKQRMDPHAASPAHRRYCRQAKEYISQHIDRHVPLEELAAYVGISRNYLTNVFTACEGMRLSEYVNRVKLNHMMELIVRYGQSMRQASEAVGFSDVNYVSRIFRKYHGVTISEYRRLLDRR